jgi:DNA-binding winged helix-turn-helix (wHTH) protein
VISVPCLTAASRKLELRILFSSACLGDARLWWYDSPVKAPAATYRFGNFTLQTGDRRLSNDGQEIYLRPKTYDALLYLLQRHGHLVTKHELLDTVWTDVEVTENALTRCIKEARAALRDDVQHPEFLRTIPRLGYEFIADVEELNEPKGEEVVEEEFRAVRVVTTGTDSDAEPSDDGAIPRSVVVYTPPAGHRVLRLRSFAVAAVLLLSFAAGAYRLLRSGVATADSPKRLMMGVLRVWSHSVTPPLAFAPRDYVLISDFENQTGDPDFDRCLSIALATSLDQSSVANVYSPARLKETLRRMEKPDVEHIDEALALEIAKREGIKALVVPTISGVGGSY